MPKEACSTNVFLFVLVIATSAWSSVYASPTSSIDTPLRWGLGVRFSGAPAWSAAGVGGGTVGLYTKIIDFEVGYSSYGDNAASKTWLSEAFATIKSKQRLGLNDNLLLGFTYVSLSGQILNVSLNSGNMIGIFVGVQHYVGEDFVTEFQFLPFASTTIQFSTTTTQSTYFGAYTFGMTYLL